LPYSTGLFFCAKTRGAGAGRYLNFEEKDVRVPLAWARATWRRRHDHETEAIAVVVSQTSARSVSSATAAGA